jgi:tRNA-dihydrouridine synthase
MISRAVNLTKVPIIGNGDLLTVTDIENAFKNSGCYALMIGRGALKSPWLAAQYKNKWSRVETVKQILEYYERIEWFYKIYGDSDEIVLKRMKGLTRYIFSHEEVNLSPILRMQTLDQFKPMLPQIVNSVFQ